MLGLSSKRKTRKEKEKSKRKQTRNSNEAKDLEELLKRLAFLECSVLDLKSDVDGLRNKILKSPNMVENLNKEKINQKKVLNREERDKEFQMSPLGLGKYSDVVESSNQVEATFHSKNLNKFNVDPSSEQQILQNRKKKVNITKPMVYKYHTRGKCLRSSAADQSQLKHCSKVKTSKSFNKCDLAMNKVERGKEIEITPQRKDDFESSNQVEAMFLSEDMSKSNVNPTSEQQISCNPKKKAIITNSKASDCPTPGKRLRSSTAILTHLKLHSRIKTSKSSNNCGRKVLLHKKQDQNPRKLHKCQICDKIFSSGFTLSRHIKIHTGERHFKCELCLKEFFRKDDLEVHVRRHLGEKIHNCSLCKLKFVSKSDLAGHFAYKHAAVKPFSCLFCAKGYVSQCSLYRHLRSHTREKPFTCPTCSREFAIKHSLRNHMKCNKH